MSEHVAMDAVPWVLLGDARRAALCKRISDCTEVWRERWSRAREDITVTIGEPEARRPLVEAARAVCMGSVRWGWLLSARSTHDVAPDLLGMSGPGELRAAFSTSIAAQVQRQILESLCADVLAAANVQDRMTLEGSAAEAGSARQPAPLGVEVACGRMRIHLLLHARLVDALLPKSSATRPLPQVQRRKDAIAPERVRFEAVLGEVEVSLGELAELSVGDVIVLDQPLRTCGHLVMPDGRKVAPIVLGTAGTALAVSITAEPLGRGTQVIEE